MLRRRGIIGDNSGGGVTLQGYIIDQTGTYTDPAQMITTTTDSDIQIGIIRSNSHLYECGQVNGILQCRQLNDSNKLQYSDGTTLTPTIGKDIFMKLPEFWWSCKDIDSDGDIFEVIFSADNPKNNNWFHWDGNTFIGAYTGYIENGLLYSLSGKTISRGVFEDSLLSGVSRGAGYSVTTYETCKIMALLIAGYKHLLSVVSSQKSASTTGNQDNHGMTDDVPTSNNLNNLWGIEDWDNPYHPQWLGNIGKDSSNGDIKIMNPNRTEVIRTSSGGLVTGWGVVNKIRAGQFCDIFAKKSNDPNTAGAYYNCNGRVMSNNDIRALRSVGTYNTGGLFGVDIHPQYGSYTACSRLEYTGNYQIIT